MEFVIVAIHQIRSHHSFIYLFIHLLRVSDRHSRYIRNHSAMYHQLPLRSNMRLNSRIYTQTDNAVPSVPVDSVH